MATGRSIEPGERPPSQWFELVVEHSPDAVLAFDADGFILYANPAAHWWLDFEIGDLAGKNIIDFVHPDDQERAIETLAFASDERAGWRPAVPFRIIRSDGQIIVMDILGTSLLHDPSLNFGLVNAREAGDHALAQEIMDMLAGNATFEEIASLLVRMYERPTWLMDSSIRYYANDETVRAVHSGLPDELAGLDDGRTDAPWHEALRTGEKVLRPSLDDLPPWLQSAARAAGKSAVWCVPVPDPGRTENACVIVWNGEFVLPTLGQGLMLERQVKLLRLALERRDYLERLEYSAHHDQLTSVLSRRRFLELLDEAADGDEPFCVLFIDLDRFKLINDTYGHDVGDEFLQVAAGRLRANVKRTDLVGRLGGDEFAVLLWGIDDPSTIDDRTDALLHALARSANVGGRALEISASMGVSVHPRGSSQQPAELLKAADQAMFDAKRRGGNQLRVASAG